MASSSGTSRPHRFRSGDEEPWRRSGETAFGLLEASTVIAALLSGRQPAHIFRNRYNQALALDDFGTKPCGLLHVPRRRTNIRTFPVRATGQAFLPTTGEENHGRKRPSDTTRRRANVSSASTETANLSHFRLMIRSSAGWSPPVRGASAMRCSDRPLAGVCGAAVVRTLPFLLRLRTAATSFRPSPVSRLTLGSRLDG